MPAIARIMGASRRALPLTALIAVTAVTPARAGVFVSASLSAASFNGGLQSQELAGGSGTIGLELGQYVNIGYTHKRQTQDRYGWMGDTEDQCVFGIDTQTCIEFKERTYTIADSVDLTLVLYNGDTVAPYILSGLILKTVDYKLIREDGKNSHIHRFIPGPNLGGGLHVRLNRQFALKLQYTVSPGEAQKPDGTDQKVWDKDMSLGLTYQL